MLDLTIDITWDLVHGAPPEKVGRNLVPRVSLSPIPGDGKKRDPGNEVEWSIEIQTSLVTDYTGDLATLEMD